jgi:dihydroxy-acid dehydratase
MPSLPCIGDGRQSGTSGSPSILNASPEAAAGGGLALLQDRRPRAHRPEERAKPNILIGDRGAGRRARANWKADGGYQAFPPSQTPWQEIQRAMVDQLGRGAWC